MTAIAEASRTDERADRLKKTDGVAAVDRRARRLLLAIVFVHLAISLVHGAAHSAAGVALDPFGTAFVLIVITAGPLAGAALMCRRPRLAAAIIALAMAGALVFGFINHFIIQGTDHIAHVVPAWRTLFAATAMLLVVVEAAGVALGVRAAASDRRAS